MLSKEDTTPHPSALAYNLVILALPPLPYSHACRLAALGLGFVLALASAIPIFLVCRLRECAHPNKTAAFRWRW